MNKTFSLKTVWRFRRRRKTVFIENVLSRCLRKAYAPDINIINIDSDCSLNLESSSYLQENLSDY